MTLWSYTMRLTTPAALVMRGCPTNAGVTPLHHVPNWVTAQSECPPAPAGVSGRDLIGA
jgi:hypothetical protein